MEINKKSLSHRITDNVLGFIFKNFNRLIWKINQIEIYNDQNKKKKILNFQKEKKKLFSIIKNSDFYKLLINNLKKSNRFKKI